jgi:hypothetical protein
MKLTKGGGGLYKIADSVSEVVLDRDELAELHRQIEIFMAADLINGGWEQHNATMWRRVNYPGWYTICRAWQIIMEKK